MPKNAREHVFWALTDTDVAEDDQEYALNSVYFYDNLDRGLFNEYKENWVLVYKQRVVKYGERRQISNCQISIAKCLASFTSQLIHYFVKKLLILKFPQREQYFPSVLVMEENIWFDIFKLTLF